MQVDTDVLFVLYLCMCWSMTVIKLLLKLLQNNKQNNACAIKCMPYIIHVNIYLRLSKIYMQKTLASEILP